jgi:hypothetical protein
MRELGLRTYQLSCSSSLNSKTYQVPPNLLPVRWVRRGRGKNNEDLRGHGVYSGSDNDRSLLYGLFAVQREHISLNPRPYLYLAFGHHQQHPPSVSLTIPFGKSSVTPHRCQIPTIVPSSETRNKHGRPEQFPERHRGPLQTTLYPSQCRAYLRPVWLTRRNQSGCSAGMSARLGESRQFRQNTRVPKVVGFDSWGPSWRCRG